ncbi:Protein of unknown function (DUF1638) [Thermoplasmatales archaeon BRNA1]|nr:Protein of unknown function (DUF1638) [Thermoplasmatales archaeon BRNA1]
MVRKVMGVIGCPMLEDELIHGFEMDEGEKTLFVIDNIPSSSLRAKMDSKGIPYSLVSEDDAADGRVGYSDGFNILILMNRLGLHADPKALREKVEEQVRRISPRVDSIALYYGLCGNFGWDMTQWARDNGLKPTEMFRDSAGRICDDCIGAAIGGGARYLELQKTYFGMFYVIPAIAHNWKDFLDDGSATDAARNLPDDLKDELDIHSDEDYIRWMFRTCGYTNMVKMDTGLADKELFEKEFEALCERMELKPITIGDGWLTLQPAEDIYWRSKENAIDS